MDEKEGELVFNEDTHTYYYNGKLLESATGFLKRFQKTFDKKRWSIHTARVEGRPVKDVLNDWQKKSIMSNEFGTRVHTFAERYAKIKIGTEKIDYVAADFKEEQFKKSIIKFWSNHPELQPVEIEKRVCVPKWMIAGTVDLIIKSDDGNYYIVDWKSNEKITTFSLYDEKLLPPLEHLDDCHLNKYALQISLYRYMLEVRYRYRFDKNFMIHLREDGYEEYNVPYFKKEIEDLIKIREGELNL